MNGKRTRAAINGVRLPAIVLLLLCASSMAFTICHGFAPEQIASLPPANGNALAFGDTDHDGYKEVLLNWRDANWNFSCRILEEQGGSVYIETDTGIDIIPYATGDFDGDGLSEMVGQRGAKLFVYESLSSSTFPTELTWTSPSLSNAIGFTIVADTDRDGRLELIHSVNGAGSGQFIIFENTGDNAFNNVFASPWADTVEKKVVGDFDQDGLIEIATAGFFGVLEVYESPCDNSWEKTWSDSTGLVGSSVVGGLDTDGNGKEEIFVLGIDTPGGVLSWTTIIYEASCDNALLEVTRLSASDGSSGISGHSVGSLFPSGARQYAANAGNSLYIYQSAAVGQWVLIDQITESPNPHLGVFFEDVNGNGKDELYWTSNSFETTVLEVPTTSSSEEWTLTPVSQLVLSPSPSQLGTAARFLNVPPSSSWLRVFNVNGRLVHQEPVIPNAAGHVKWHVQGIAPGVYFLRLESAAGRETGTTRTVVIPKKE